MYYVFMQMLSSGPAWLSIILLITLSLLPDVLSKVLCRVLWPSATEHAQVGRPRHAHTPRPPQERTRKHASVDTHERRHTSVDDTLQTYLCKLNTPPSKHKIGRASCRERVSSPV